MAAAGGIHGRHAAGSGLPKYGFPRRWPITTGVMYDDQLTLET